MTKSDIITVNIADDFYASQKAVKYVLQNGYGVVFNDLLARLRLKDLSLINLESPLTSYLNPINKTGPNLASLPQAIKIIKHGGFDIACMANNHILDYGKNGLENTIKLCTLNGIRHIGAGSNLEEAEKILYEDVKGIRLALINVTENEFSIASRNFAGANPLDIIGNVKKIKTAKNRADYLLMIFHGGLEHYHLPTPQMVKVLRFFIECGVDAIVCHHSHYPTGYEIFQNKPIFYGIGNFFFDLPAPTRQWNFGYLVTLKINVNSLTTDFEITPFTQNYTTFGISELKQMEHLNFMTEINRLSTIIQSESEINLNWEKYLSNKSINISASLFPFIPFKRRILSRAKIPQIMLNKILGMLNSIRCESLREYYTDGLKEYLKNKD